MFERQRERADARIHESVEPRLQRGEEIVSAIHALTRVRWVLATLPLLAIVFWLEYSGSGGYSPLIVGAWFGFVYLAYVRIFFVVVTNRRTLLLRLRRVSSKHVSDEWEVQGTPEYRDGFLSGFLTVEAGGQTFQLQVPAAFKDRARAVAGVNEREQAQ